MDDVTVEAAKQYLENESSVEVAKSGVFLQNIRGLARDEQDVVARYREHKIFGADKQSMARTKEELDALAPQGALIICDDYKPDLSNHPVLPPSPSQPKSSVLPWALAAALGAGGLGALAGTMLAKDKPVVEQPQKPPVDSNSGVATNVGSTTQLIQGQ